MQYRPARFAAERGVPFLSLYYDGKLPQVTDVSAVALVRESEAICFIEHTERGWELPGGKVEEDEKALAAAKRECTEETGLHPTSLAPVCVVGLYNGSDVVSKHVWQSNSWRQRMNPDDETATVRWWETAPPSLSFGLYEKAVLDCLDFPLN